MRVSDHIPSRIHVKPLRSIRESKEGLSFSSLRVSIQTGEEREDDVTLYPDRHQRRVHSHGSDGTMVTGVTPLPRFPQLQTGFPGKRVSKSSVTVESTY